MKPGVVALPPNDVTTIFPLAPFPTIAVIVVEFTTLKDDADIPPKLTPVIATKFVPVIVTVFPVVADDGANELIVGRGYVKVKLEDEELDPFGETTVTIPVFPKLVIAVIVVELTTLSDCADIPPN